MAWLREKRILKFAYHSPRSDVDHDLRPALRRTVETFYSLPVSEYPAQEIS